jgi:hypothetical protein
MISLCFNAYIKKENSRSTLKFYIRVMYVALGQHRPIIDNLDVLFKSPVGDEGLNGFENSAIPEGYFSRRRYIPYTPPVFACIVW